MFGSEREKPAYPSAIGWNSRGCAVGVGSLEKQLLDTSRSTCFHKSNQPMLLPIQVVENLNNRGFHSEKRVIGWPDVSPT